MNTVTFRPMAVPLGSPRFQATPPSTHARIPLPHTRPEQFERQENLHRTQPNTAHFSGWFNWGSSDPLSKVKQEAHTLFNHYYDDPQGLIDYLESHYNVAVYAGGWAAGVLGQLGATGMFMAPYSRDYGRLPIAQRLDGYPPGFPIDIARQHEQSGQSILLLSNLDTDKATLFEEVFHLLQDAHGLKTGCHPALDYAQGRFISDLDAGIDARLDPGVLRDRHVIRWIQEQVDELKTNPALAAEVQQSAQREQEVCDFMMENTRLLTGYDVNYYRYYQAFYAALLKAF